MFYHWLAPLGKTHIIFNLFNYRGILGTRQTYSQNPRRRRAPSNEI